MPFAQVLKQAQMAPQPLKPHCQGHFAPSVGFRPGVHKGASSHLPNRAGHGHINPAHGTQIGFVGGHGHIKVAHAPVVLHAGRHGLLAQMHTGHGVGHGRINPAYGSPLGYIVTNDGRIVPLYGYPMRGHGHLAPIHNSHKAAARDYYLGVIGGAWQNSAFAPIQHKMGQLRALLDNADYSEDALDSMLRVIIEYLEKLNAEARKKANCNEQLTHCSSRKNLIEQLVLHMPSRAGREKLIQVGHWRNAVTDSSAEDVTASDAGKTEEKSLSSNKQRHSEDEQGEDNQR
jgi:hypothetical protein